MNTNLFNEIIDKYRPTNTFEECDLFASLVFPKQAATRRDIYTIDFGTAGQYDSEPLVNTESLKNMGENFIKMTFRLDYFDQLKVISYFATKRRKEVC